MTEVKKTKSQVQNELDRVQQQFDNFNQEIKDMTLDRSNHAAKEEQEQQTQFTSKDIRNSKDIYLKPERTVAPRDKFNENFRSKYNYAKEYVQFIAENREIIGEDIETWTRPFGGMPAEFWRVPTNKPVWGPRYLAEQIKKCYYHRFVMQQTVTQNTHAGQMYGTLAADTTIQRLDAYPAKSRGSIFMRASGF